MPLKKSAPLCDAVVSAVSRLIDDSQMERREPSHSDIQFQITRAGLADGDPGQKPGHPPVGKMKRLRSTLSWSIENNPPGGEQLVISIIDLVRSLGGFRQSSSNYVGTEPILNATNAFRAEGYELSADGELHPVVLDALSGVQLTEALEAYVKRAKRGSTDAALLAGTSKDLLEATAAHVVVERYGQDPGKANFPTLLEWAFISLEMATPKNPVLPGERASKRLERALYESACAVNNLRNKEGTGHGRPWIPAITDAEAKIATELIGCIAERLLVAHKELPIRRYS